MLTYDTPALRQTGSRNLTGQKTLPAISGTYMKLVTKYQISAINSCWEKLDEKWAYMLNMYKNQQSRKKGSRNLMVPKTHTMIWGTYMKLVTKYQISAINSCWEKCDEKCAYMVNVYRNQLSRQTGSRNLTGPKTLPTISHTYMKLVTKYQIPVINSCSEKCDEKCAYTNICNLNVYKNQQNRQTGSRNLMGPKTIPTIWGTYMKVVTKYQISAINSCWEKCDEKCEYMVNVYRNQLSRQTGSRNLTGPKTLPTIWYTYMKLVTKY
jgi:ribosome biogenesis protein Tsr3